MELKNIAILGPRGNVGTAIVKELLKDGPRFNITAITRPTSTYTAPEGSNITTIPVDHDSIEALATAFKGQDAVVNCVTGGATQYEPSKRIIDAAVAAGVKFFFNNEFAGDTESEQYRRLPESFVGAKIRTREYLKSLNKEGKISWSALNGGPFFDMWLMRGPAGFNVPNKRARIYGTGTNPLFWTPLPAIALAATNMLRNPTPILNRPIFITTVKNNTQNAILSALEKVLDTKFSIEYVDIKKINENALAALKAGDIPKAMKGLTLSNQFYEGDCGNDLSALMENETVGVEPVSVEVAVRQAIEIYGTDTPVVEALFQVDP